MPIVSPRASWRVLAAAALLGALILLAVMPAIADASEIGRSSWGVFSWGLLAAAGVPSPNSHLALPTVQALALVIGALVPLGTYILNHYAPWVSEPVKGLVLVGLAAAAGALTQLLNAGDLAFDVETLEVVGIAVVGALTAHHGLWKPAAISTALGGGTNR